MTFEARFPGTCTACRSAICVGARIERAATRGYQHAACPSAAPVAAWNEDTDAAPEDPNSPHYCRANCPCRKGLRAAPFNQATQRDADDDSYDVWITFRDSAWAQSDTQIARAAAVEAQTRELTPDDAGVYVLPDGTIVNLKATRKVAGQEQRVYPEKWIVFGGRRLVETGSVENGKYEYADDWRVRKALRDQVASVGRKLTLAEAQAFSIRFGCCVRCEAFLSDALSVKLGIGSTCIKYVDFDPEALATAKAEVKAALKAAKAATKGAPAPAPIDAEAPVSALRDRQVDAWLSAKLGRSDSAEAAS